MKNKLNLLIYFLKKDIKARYAGSGLGLLWTIFTPLVQIVLFWFVFSGIMKARPYANTQMPYIYFLLSSFFFWLAFSEGISRASNVIIENSEIVKKISFPNILLPVTVTISSYLLNILGFLFFMIAYATTTTFSPVICPGYSCTFLAVFVFTGVRYVFGSAFTLYQGFRANPWIYLARNIFCVADHIQHRVGT